MDQPTNQESTNNSKLQKLMHSAPKFALLLTGCWLALVVIDFIGGLLTLVAITGCAYTIWQTGKFALEDHEVEKEEYTFDENGRLCKTPQRPFGQFHTKR